MSHELAYGYELLDDASTSALTDELLSCFGESARYFDVPSHVRIPQANFDEGVVVCDATRIGMLWFESDSPGRRSTKWQFLAWFVFSFDQEKTE